MSIITEVPDGGWPEESLYLVTQATRLQAKNYLQNNGVSLSAARRFLVGEDKEVSYNNKTIKCNRKGFLVVDSWRVIKVDYHYMQWFGDKILALVNSAPKTYLMDRAEVTERIKTATARNMEVV